MKFKTLVFLFLAICANRGFAQARELYQIKNVDYNIKGATREYPLSKSVEISNDRFFSSQEELNQYIRDIEQLFLNLRVLESVRIDITYGDPDATGTIPVYLVVNTADTWNLIIVPYPELDSNSGFTLKLKLKDFNFFGTMQTLTSDINYNVDIDGQQAISGNLDFTIPFKAWGYSFEWDLSAYINIPIDELVTLEFSTGIDFELPLGFSDMHIGAEQSVVWNDRDSKDVLYEDWLYFTEDVYLKLPIVLTTLSYFGDVSWTPALNFEFNWDHNGISDPDLKGPTLTASHSLGFDRIDWERNFRRGVAASLGNSYTYNFGKNKFEISINTKVRGYISFFNIFGLSGQFYFFYDFFDETNDDQGDMLRGILDDRITTDTAFSLNIDIPIRIMHINFEEITGVGWTRYVSFEMHLALFFDMALVHDIQKGTYYSFKDGWYAGGLEVIVYPLKMRSIYVRASLGFDLAELFTNGFDTGASAKRDGENIQEISIGIGLHY
ncbi:hypothetical protein K7I13_01625 [Brucepastera parasyntrophica]|uniref:hypothetical protein n=1 Tax=Brucepastera parasyntrophica TaxID=2880008 RepID=UPI00210D7283|nr:hypothetical protein [Brucepastera parasyntrophica]ULQ60057.1 hypothetical protein K7I13_01625 [Brucepastera parasyntrophica]